MSAEQHPAGALLAAAAKQALSTPEGQKLVQVVKKAGAAVRAVREEGERIDARSRENAGKVRDLGDALRDLLGGKGHG